VIKFGSAKMLLFFNILKVLQRVYYLVKLPGLFLLLELSKGLILLFFVYLS